MRAITFIRHGQSEFNRHWAATGTDPLIRDAPLSDLGHEQVRAARAAALALEPDVVISSPLTRALQTAVGLFGDGGTVPIRILGRRLDNCEIAPYLNSIQPIAATAAPTDSTRPRSTTAPRMPSARTGESARRPSPTTATTQARATTGPGRIAHRPILAVTPPSYC